MDQSIAELESALELEEDMPEALIGMANIYLQQGDFAAAIDALERAIQGAPNAPEAYYALGEAYAQSGDKDSACEAYSQFMDLNPPSNWRAQAQQMMTALGCP